MDAVVKPWHDDKDGGPTRMSFGPHLLLASLEGAVMAAVLALTALGLSLVFGVMRIVNVAHGEFYMLGAVAAWFFASLVPGQPALGFALALVCSPLLVGAVAVLAERLVLRRLDYDPEATIVATIGLLYILQQLALTFYGADARPVPAPVTFRVQFPWFGYSGYKLVVIAASALLVVGTWLVLTRTRIGLVMRATQYDRETAQAFGIPVGRVYALVFALGAMLAAIAAVLIVPISQAHYLMGLDPLLLSFIVVIIGGLGSIQGTIVAALVIGMSDGIISVFFSPTLSKIIATLLVALVLVFRPQGLFGSPALGGAR
jgi:branched-chain amino acid transport system permease protein